MYYRSLIQFVSILASAALICACATGNSVNSGEQPSMRHNPVSYFEIPVSDMDRAVAFYQAVFSISLQRTVIDGHEMALFPADDKAQGASGALAKGDSYTPSASGPRLYFFVDDIDLILQKASGLGSDIAYPKTSVGDFWLAEFVDSEGNQIALSSAKE